MAASSGRTGGRGVRDFLGVGALAGAAAWVVGYLVAYVITSDKASQMASDVTGAGQQAGASVSSDLSTWKGVGMYFFGGHFVDTKVSMSFLGQSRTQTANILSESNIGGSEVLYVAPAALLLVAAFLLVRSRGGVRNPVDGAKIGATVAAGYFVLTAASAFLMEASVSVSSTSGGQMGGQSLSMTVGPETAMAIVLAGVAYPLIFGAVGGYAGAATGS